MNDSTENVRRKMVAEINSNPNERELLQKEYGDVWDTKEATEIFEFIGFMAPFVMVRRLSDDVSGTMMFQDYPRYYFNFVEEK